MYLKTNNSGYEFSIRGKNGEPIPHTHVNFMFHFIGTSEIEEKTLKTNPLGIIELNKPKLVRKITCSAKSSGSHF